jgi:TetR/AcrR family transcriptional repressor of lmrAB and yxaGH operons
MGRRTDTRKRIVGAALGAMRERGYSEMAISDLVAEANAPRGSITFHFPGGKDEIAREVVSLRTEQILADLDAVAEASLSAGAFLDTSIDRIGAEFTESGFVAGCPVVPLVIERGAKSPDLRQLAADFFSRWRGRLEEHLVAFGIDASRARSLATLTVSSVEGALTICRAEQSLDALIAVQGELRTLLTIEAPAAR